MTEKTAMQKLYELVEKIQSITDTNHLKFLTDAKEGFLKLEKEQIIHAVNKTDEKAVMLSNGLLKKLGHEWVFEHDNFLGEQYFTKTFTQQ